MKKANKPRDQTIAIMIGSMVKKLIAQGQPVNRNNILYELEKAKTTSAGLPAKAMAHDAAERLRKAGTKAVG
ncbi:hypothetical protein [Pantoea sp. S18]|uniref:hypothetical protein n=1 Tax=Pantoea sp. S18 TaxID=3019892 RepID=UPI002B21E5E7|nr:hypothetical protein [Pantoea sp. S18]MEA5105628.1 hypothetical protein [Pantoea sp. S18]